MGCRKTSEKDRLIRVVRTPDGKTVLDRNGNVNGRGAYLCRDRACLMKALKTGALSRALKVHLSEEVTELLKEEIGE